MDHMDWREPQLQGLGYASPHMHTHFIYPAHRCLCIFVTFASTRKTLHTSLFLHCVTPGPNVVLTKNHPVQTSKFPTVSSTRLPSCSLYLNPPISLLLSLILSQTSSRVDFIVASISNSMLWSNINTICDGKDISPASKGRAVLSPQKLYSFLLPPRSNALCSSLYRNVLNSLAVLCLWTEPPLFQQAVNTCVQSRGRKGCIIKPTVKLA